MDEACARIVRTTLGRHEHYGIWSAELRVEYVTDAQGAPVIIGGHALDTKPGGDGRRHGTAWGMEFLIRLLDAVPGCRSWEDLPDRLITVFLGDERTSLGLRPAVGIGPALDSRELGGRERWERACFMFDSLPTDEEAAERLAALERAAANALGSIEAVAPEHRASLGIDQARKLLRDALVQRRTDVAAAAALASAGRVADLVDTVDSLDLGEVERLVALKASGRDCTEDESATVKRYLREHYHGGHFVGISRGVADLFRLEADEVAAEPPEIFDPTTGPVMLVHTSGERGQAMRYTPETVEALADWVALFHGAPIGIDRDPPAVCVGPLDVNPGDWVIQRQDGGWSVASADSGWAYGGHA